MDPITILTLAKGAKWAWDEYRKTASEKPGRSVEELQERIAASDELVRNNFELIVALGQQVRETELQVSNQAADIARLQQRQRLLIALVASTAVVAVGSLGGVLWLAL